MSPRSAVPIDGEVAGAFAKFFHRGEGPSHTALSRAFDVSGYGDGYEYRPDVQGPNKESRVLAAFDAARLRPAGARRLLEGLLAQLRLDGKIGTGHPSDDEQRLRVALGRTGWRLTDEGMLTTFAGVEVDTGGRQALEEQLDRIQRSTADPALLIELVPTSFPQVAGP